MKLIDWRTDDDLQKHYTVTVYNIFQTLMNASTDLSCEYRYNTLIKANNEIASEILPKKRKNLKIFFATIQTSREQEKS